MTGQSMVVAAIAGLLMFGVLVVKGGRMDGVNLGLIAAGMVAIVAVLLLWPLG